MAAAVTVECRTERSSSSSTIFLGGQDGLQEHLKADVFALPIAVQPQDKVGAPLCLLLQVLAHMGLPQQALLIYQNLLSSHQDLEIHVLCIKEPCAALTAGRQVAGSLAQGQKKSDILLSHQA